MTEKKRPSYIQHVITAVFKHHDAKNSQMLYGKKI